MAWKPLSQPTVIFLSSALMIVVPAFSTVMTSVGSMIPFTHFQPPAGMFGIGAFAELYFLLSALHGFRIYRRMVHMELQEHSEYEGSALPFLYLIPGSGSFWMMRILIEPTVLYVSASLLESTYIIQSGLETYLHFAALSLVMKEFIAWHRSWLFLRRILDMRNAGPIIAKLIENNATQEDLAPLHLANFPKNVSQEARNTAAIYIARAYSIQDPVKGDSHDTH